jgi:putative transposase
MKQQQKKLRQKEVLPPLSPELQRMVESVMADYKRPEQILGETGLLKQLTKAVMEAALRAEMTEHLGHDRHAAVGNAEGNVRNGQSSKTISAQFGEVEIDIPRDRQGSFEPVLVPKHQRRFSGIDERILSLYARGLTNREIGAHLQELFEIEVSPALISTITDTVADEVRQWQSRALDALYPIVYLDCLMVKTRESGSVNARAIYMAIGVNVQGHKEVLGLWVSANEGAKFWLSVVTELKNRGVADIFIACVDGLKGFPEAIESVFPKTQVQLCIVHMVRNSLRYVGWKDRKALAADLRTVYTAATANAAEAALDTFAGKWDAQYAQIAKSWRTHWARVTPLFEYPAEIRKVIYTTNAIESVNFSLRKIIKNRASFPSDEAAIKLIYLALRNIVQKWTMPVQNWKQAMSQFMIRFEDRFTQP